MAQGLNQAACSGTADTAHHPRPPGGENCYYHNSLCFMFSPTILPAAERTRPPTEVQTVNTGMQSYYCLILFKGWHCRDAFDYEGTKAGF